MRYNHLGIPTTGPRRISKRIVLIDGHELASLLIEFGVGVAVAKQYPVHRVDLDYFEEEG